MIYFCTKSIKLALNLLVYFALCFVSPMRWDKFYDEMHFVEEKKVFERKCVVLYAKVFGKLEAFHIVSAS
jgi:hypothetical protein